MSWGIIAGGPSADAAAAAKQQIEQGKQYSHSDAHRDVVAGIGAAINAFAARFPEHVILIESNGHIDAHAGNATLNLRAFPKLASNA